MEHKYSREIIGIELVRGCNFKCRMCTVTANHKGSMNFMSLDVLQTILNKICDEDIKPNLVYLFNFGEPLAHPEFRKVLELIYKSKAFENSINIMHTNASLLKGDKAQAILDIPIITKLVFSFDGFGDKESYTKLRGDHFDEVLENIRNFSKIAKVRRPELQMETATIIPREGEVLDLEVKSLRESNKKLKEIFEPIGVNVVTRYMHSYSGQDNLEIEGIMPYNLGGGVCI